MKVFVLFFITIIVSAQNDTLKIDFDRLNWGNVKKSINSKKYDVVVSGSRSEKKIEDLPFTIYVITEEEIKENNYITLTDALKTIPGIRVSQPGSYISGDLFLMRGLLGNSYAKILINDIPLSPFLVNSFPLGAQLPISQAQRIEIIYGPVATLYGADASAGVINIILKESTRPFYVSANIDHGSNGFFNTDISLGGQIGKGKNVMKYTFFGRQTGMNDRSIKYDIDNLYNAEKYFKTLYPEDDNDPEGNIELENQPNLLGAPSKPLLGQYPHQSKLVGLDITSGNFKFNGYHLYRKDHAALGLNTLAVSHGQPFNSFGETISLFNLQYEKKMSKYSWRIRTRYLGYRTLKGNNTAYVFPLISYVRQLYLNDEDLSLLEENREHIIETYFNGNRYNEAYSNEYAIEGFVDVKLSENINFSLGVNAINGSGLPLQNFKKKPPGQDEVAIDTPVLVSKVDLLEFSTFMEWYINLKNLNIIIGGQYQKRKTDLLKNLKPIFNPRFGVQYKVNSKTNIRFSYSEAFRFPSPYFGANTFLIGFENLEPTQTGSPELTPEKTDSFEIGIRFSPKEDLHFDASIFKTKTTSFINYGAAQIEGEDSSTLSIGYFNDGASFLEIYGIQLSATAKKLIPSINLNGTFNFNYNIAKGKTTLILESGFPPEFKHLDKAPSLPQVISQLRLDLEPLKNIKLIIDNTFVTSSNTRNTIAYFEDSLLNIENDGFYTMDLGLYFQISKKNSLHFKTINLFNKQYAGIDANQDSDALFYNPQSLRIFQIGLKYNIN